MFQSSPTDIGKQKEGKTTLLVEIESIHFLLTINPYKFCLEYDCRFYSLFLF